MHCQNYCFGSRIRALLIWCKETRELLAAMAKLIDGRAVARALRAAIKGEVEALSTKYGRVRGLHPLSVTPYP